MNDRNVAEQSVAIKLTRADLATTAADLRYEVPYEYSITISPWLVRVFKPKSGKTPTSITWTAPYQFEIEFKEAHFATKNLYSTKQKDNQWIAHSGPLIEAQNPRNGRYQYWITIHPDLPKPRGGDALNESMLKAQRTQHFVKIDPDYIIEDK